MKKSKNPAVQQFLEDVQLADPEKYQILQKVRAVVFSKIPKTSERIIYGGIMFTLVDDFGGIFCSKNHVSFEFSQGYLLQDPDKFLEGKGKYRRHLKLKSQSDITEKNVEFFVSQLK